FVVEEFVIGLVCLVVSHKPPFARRQSVWFADAVREPFIGLVREKFPRYEEYLAAVFAGVNEKPRIVEEHDGWPGVVSSVAGGSGGALSSGVFNFAFRGGVKQFRLTPEPKPGTVGIGTRERKHSPPPEKFCQCAKQAAGAIRSS